MKTIVAMMASLLIATCTPRIVTKPAVHLPGFCIGNFTDDYGITYSISDQTWIQHPGVTYHIIAYDSAGQYLLARNDQSNPSEKNLYTRIDIMQFEKMEPFTWGFCLTRYNAKTAEEARRTASADRMNPRKGCGGYPFSRMKKM